MARFIDEVPPLGIRYTVDVKRIHTVDTPQGLEAELLEAFCGNVYTGESYEDAYSVLMDEVRWWTEHFDMLDTGESVKILMSSSVYGKQEELDVRTASSLGVW